MEHIIAKLLRDFEDGFMNRRQLIQSLALAATAAVGGTAYAQTPRVTRDFYADLMGMEVKNDNGKPQCELYFGNSMLLARNHFRPPGGEVSVTTPAAAPVVAAPQAGNRPTPTSLVDHIAYGIYNWDTDQVREELMRRKLLTDTALPDTGGGIMVYSSFHVNDPDGFNLQISGWAGPKDSVAKKK